MSPTIRIDEEVFAHLQENARPLVDNPNTVLRRLLGLDADSTHTKGSPAPSPAGPSSDASTGAPTNEVVYAKGPDCSASGRVTPDAFYVLKGSLARKHATRSLPNHHARLRRQLRDHGVMVDDGRSYRFTTDWSFDTPSAAACVVLGGSANGLLAWKNDRGLALADIRRG